MAGDADKHAGSWEPEDNLTRQPRWKRTEELANAHASSSEPSPRRPSSPRHHLTRRRSTDDTLGERGKSVDPSIKMADHDRSVVDSLDLSPSLPYWLAYFKAHMTRHVTELNQSMKQLIESKSSAREVLGSPFATVSSRVDLAATELRRLHANMLQVLSDYSKRGASASLVPERVRVLMSDWERRARTFHPSVFLPPHMGLNDEILSQPELVLGPDYQVPQWTYSFRFDDLPGDWLEQIRHWPEMTTQWVDGLHGRLETLRTYANNFANAYGAHLASDDHQNPRSLVETIGGQGTFLLRRFEQTWLEVGKRGKERAVHLMHDVEDVLYHAALDLAHEGQKLIHFHALPPIWRNNHYILTGYRFIPLDRWQTLLRSVFQIHNETGNIHTHLWGLVMIMFFFWLDVGLDRDTTSTDRLIQTLYLIAAAKCLTCSVSWHVMAGCADRQWFLCFACIDYTGIAMLVAASLLTLVYNGFYCQPQIFLAYSTGIAALGITMGLVPWLSWFDRNRPLRIKLFVLMAMSGMLPFLHALILRGLWPVTSFFLPVVPSIAMYVTGVFVYALRFPERVAPGRFDIIGHSHQLWHIATVLAILLHYRAILLFHANRFEFSCVPKPASPLVEWNVAPALGGQ